MLLTIEKLIYGGDGLAHLPADERGRGKAVFLPFVLAGETIEATITQQKSGFARAQTESIIEPSPQRIAPDCPCFTHCGGCHYQHSTYEHQLEIKKEILREAFRRTAKLESVHEIQVHPSPPWNYRNRSRLQVQITPAFSAGYFKMASHALLAVEQCPISSPLINRGIAALWQFGRSGKAPQGITEVEFFADAEDAQMLVEISCASDSRRAAVRAWAEDLASSMPEIAGVVAFRIANPGAKHPREKWLAVGADHLVYRTGKSAYRVSAGSFFQTNRHLTDELIRIVTEGQSGKLALDLYAGAGLFSTTLRDFDHVVSVEMSQTSSADLAYNLPSNGEAIRATADQYLARTESRERVGKGNLLPQVLLTPDLAVVDPPRSGLGERVARLLATLGAPRIVYISCDPATLARDLLILLEHGYRIEQVHLVDLFPQTYHLEAVVHLAR